ncbi:neutral zinc metallopeptidase [Alteriqipengyuania flavescens]|uniref:KPN_02809 family neutral zinc metallopeptidase n=1 Tax=Alteriqipengyuania flavescens TaxID=3053610 RepID=UPI0025B2ABEA|nr:neutral zinc metallopeptidase [Alteriqipengyuania flavescens]WJY18108.1 neutral zinc metallopeptidase [Alteriqipengyuania flavescens]WJY24049.1 neutral zinc metallopeptidase [Alteriqipengyuania flavescens]
MRLNPFNTGNIDVRGGGGGGGLGGGGKLGCGAIVIALVGAVVFGIDPMTTLSTVGGTSSAPETSSSATEEELCSANQYAQESCAALGSLNETWSRVFAQQGYDFQQPFLNFYSGRVRSGCGAASSAAGPFYCPADGGIYIDTGFYDVLDRQLGAPGDFARYYVMAHEYGHHIQNITGIANSIRSAQGQNPRAANQLQVRMELQADCYAGVWAAKNRNLIEPGDLEEGLRAAAAIGDDRLTGGRVSSENFTHGTSRQRSEALRLGLQGDDRACDEITNIR